ncbi:MarR family winged helix-turn-helix transcriptional regulator [Novosphingobium sp. Gsoil 351]|uniref:MarR family winged helix-turn-helix transcriptional regulator n=1 Tax=Novosphingobium sp. Gsoil 351 TaxID=2675225 RepID=UPI00351ABBD3
MPASLTDEHYQALANFRYALRTFLAFSGSQVARFGLTPQQHQALLAVRAATQEADIGYVAERLIIKPHSASGLVARLEATGFVTSQSSQKDRRQRLIVLTRKGRDVLERLSVINRGKSIAYARFLKRC